MYSKQPKAVKVSLSTNIRRLDKRIEKRKLEEKLTKTLRSKFRGYPFVKIFPSRKHLRIRCMKRLQNNIIDFICLNKKYSLRFAINKNEYITVLEFKYI